jgi:Uncharacterized protein conserved in bacteria
MGRHKTKNQHNIAKHGIDFTDAPGNFTNPIVVRSDERREYGEQRWLALGKLGSIIVVLVFTRRGNKIRIYSIRKGNKHERQVYQDQITAHSN